MPLDQPPAIIQMLRPDNSSPVAQTWTSSGTINVAKMDEGPPSLIISNGTKEIIRLSFKDGSVTYAEGVTPDEASKVFWDQVTKMYPLACKPSP